MECETSGQPNSTCAFSVRAVNPELDLRQLYLTCAFSVRTELRARLEEIVLNMCVFCAC